MLTLVFLKYRNKIKPACYEHPISPVAISLFPTGLHCQRNRVKHWIKLKDIGKIGWNCTKYWSATLSSFFVNTNKCFSFSAARYFSFSLSLFLFFSFFLSLLLFSFSFSLFVSLFLSLFLLCYVFCVDRTGLKSKLHWFFSSSVLVLIPVTCCVRLITATEISQIKTQIPQTERN